METDNSSLHQLLQKLIAEEKLDPILAKKLLDEIIAIIVNYKKSNDNK